ncbi:MAG: stage 0 sporulation family protein [bacterium]
MPEKIGIRFKSCGKIYYFDSSDLEVKKGDNVVVESSFGMTIGRAVTDRMPVLQEERELKKVIRKATEDDFSTQQRNTELEKEARAFCIERIKARGLQMKLVCTEAALDKKRIIFYFTADGRIDFRELVKDLASKFKTRIEMRQIGVRDETKLLGGIGICGKEVCCKTFLTSFAPISIKMAKKQELVLNTSKLSGICGRLLCCLNYEIDQEGVQKRAASREADRTAEAEEAYAESSKQQEERHTLYEDAGSAVALDTAREARSVRAVPVPEEVKATGPLQMTEQAREAPSGQPQGQPGQGDHHRRSRKFHRRRRKKKKQSS